MTSVGRYIEDVRTELARGPEVERLATVQLLLRGSPITRPRAEAQLGYALTGHHLAAILWGDSQEQPASLDAAAERVMRACGASRRLTLIAGTTTLWVWMPVATPPAQTDLDQIVAAGGHLWACRMSADMMKITEADLRDDVEGIISAADFIELTAGAQLLFI